MNERYHGEEKRVNKFQGVWKLYRTGCECNTKYETVILNLSGGTGLELPELKLRI
jgi:hypothetical protein